MDQTVFQLSYTFTNILLLLLSLFFHRTEFSILLCGSIPILIVSLLCWKFHIVNLPGWWITLWAWGGGSAITWCYCSNNMLWETTNPNKLVNVTSFSLSYLHPMGKKRYGRFWDNMKLYWILFFQTLFTSVLFSCTLLVDLVGNIKTDLPCLCLYMIWVL